MKKWAVVLVVIVGVGVLGLVALVGVGFYVFTTHVDIQNATDQESAYRTLDETRARFSGQTPLVTFGPDGPRVNRTLPAGETLPESLHVMAWDVDEARLLTLRLPMWLIRMSDDGRVDFDTNDGDPFSLDLTVADLDHHGPGLVVEYEDEGEGRVIVWLE